MGLFENMALGFCKWDFFALLFIATVIVLFFLDRRRLNKQIEDLKNQL